MKIALCDDSKSDLLEIERIMADIKIQLGERVETKCYNSGESLIEAVKSGDSFDLAILDIFLCSDEENKLGGIETARSIKLLLPEVQLAFLTASTDFALDAIELNALHYLVKPVDADKAAELMERYFERVHSHVKPLRIEYGGKVYSLSPLKIRKLVSARRGTDIYFSGQDRPMHIPVPFSKTEEQLDLKAFLKISRGLIVRMSYISYLGRGICRMADGTESLLSRKDRSNILSKYNDYLFREQVDINDLDRGR